MPNVTQATVFPESQQWLGIARELAAGTAVNPTNSIPITQGIGQNKPVMLKDVSERGVMAKTHAVIEGTQSGELNPEGNIYLDTIGFLLHNIMGDYQAAGSTPTSATTVSATTAAGATSFTVGAIGSIVIGSILQFGNATLGTAPTEILVVSNVAGSVVTFATTPCRFAHSASAAVAIVAAPFTHTFSLLESGQGQPPTHTLTHFTGATATYGARQFPFWTASDLSFQFDVEKLATYQAKGMSWIGQSPTASITNNESNVQALPSWLTKIGVGGPASGGTLLNNISAVSIDLARTLKGFYGLNGQQDPSYIARSVFDVTGKFTFLAQDESPLTALLANTTQQLQVILSNGLSGASLLSIQFDMQTTNYDEATIAEADYMTWEMPWQASDNTTNAGASGLTSPLKVTLTNAFPTY